MKRIVLLLFVVAMMPTRILAQSNDGFNSEQIKMRSDLVSFLKVEGYMPEIDSDGDIKFKSEGDTYFISINKSDENPMYVTLWKGFSYPDNYSLETMILASKEINSYKGIKMLFLDKSFQLRAELFVRNAEPLKSAFYKLMNQIKSAEEDVIDECDNVSTSTSSLSGSGVDIPFIIKEMQVANVENDGTIIQDYGSSIYDFKTKYLKPRITIQPIKKSGTYTVSVRLYKDNKLERNSKSSPADFTYTSDVYVSGNSSQICTLSGWGSSNAGTWSMGDYRFEVWYGDMCLGSKKFKVY